MSAYLRIISAEKITVNDEMLKENAPAEVIAQVEEAKQKIIDGELTVKGYKDFANEEEYNAYINTFAP